MRIANITDQFFKKLKFLATLFVLLIFVGHDSYAKSNNVVIIRDSEIEETINLIAKPIFEKANLKDVKIYIINDPTVNAFTTSGNEIYIYSGLINQFPDIDVLRGVIAHETGHIVGGHVMRGQGNASTYSKVAISSVIAGIAGAIVSNNPDVGNAVALGGMHFAERSFLSYSRSFESSADQAALRLLESSNNTAKGMIDFFEYMDKYHNSSFINPYDKTHPSDRERLTLLRNFYQQSAFKGSQNTSSLEYKFARSRAKLIAFTAEPHKLQESLPKDLDPEITYYIKAITCMRSSEKDKALLYINKLLALKPKDAFFNELKGQILFDFGQRDALLYYNKAINLRQDDKLLRLSRAIVGITVYNEQPNKMGQFEKDLKQVLANEPENNLALQYLSIFYYKTGDQAKSWLYLALIAKNAGNLNKARTLAGQAIKGLAQNTPDWYKAQDILLTEQ